MFLNLTNILISKFIKQFKENDILNFYNLESSSEFICIGSIYSIIPKDLKTSSDCLEVDFTTERLDFDRYILSLKKISNHEVMDLKSKIVFNINPNTTPKQFSSSEESEYFSRPLVINIEIVLEENEHVRKLINELIGEYNEINPNLTEVQSKAKNKYLKRKDELLKKHFRENDLEKSILTAGVEIYEKKPDIGTLFGYIGPLNYIVPINYQSNKYSFSSITPLNSIKYPLILKKIDEFVAVDIITNTKFSLSLLDQENEYAYFSYPLHLRKGYYIVLNETFKSIYVNSILDYGAYKKWILSLEEYARKQYEIKLAELKEKLNTQINEAYDIARIDNMIFDIEKRLKKEDN